VQGSGFRVSGSGVPGLRLWVSGFGFRVSGKGSTSASSGGVGYGKSRTSGMHLGFGLGFGDSGFGFRVQYFGFWVRVPDSGFQDLGIGVRGSEFGNRELELGRT